MPLKKHHKIILGGAGSFLVIILIINSVLLYFLYIKLNQNQTQLENEISQLQTETQSKINELTSSILETKSSISNLGESVSSLDQSINQEINKLKASASSDFSGIIEESIPAVLTVMTDVGQGTGFVINSAGYFITNAHVLSGGTRVTAINSEQERISVQLIGYNLDYDIALLKIQSNNYPYLNLENSYNIQVGEKVIAIGNPLGLQFSVSEGIVSALDRIGDNGVAAYIQTDAALNPGNSGGPLINKEGNVIGINNFKIGGGESLGFALESNYIKEVVNDISTKAINQTLI